MDEVGGGGWRWVEKVGGGGASKRLIRDRYHTRISTIESGVLSRCQIRATRILNEGGEGGCGEMSMALGRAQSVEQKDI